MKLRSYEDACPPDLGARLSAFERQFRYPLGRDHFRIDHGADYLAFFRTLGRPVLFVLESADLVVGVLVAVERELVRDGERTRLWYLGDLKVDPKAAPSMASLRLLEAFEHELGAAPAYGISMNPGDGPNRLLRVFEKVSRGRVRHRADLVFFNFDFASWSAVEALAREHFGRVGFVDHRGTKDIVLQSSGRAMPLLHAQHGPFARFASTEGQERHVHMLCVPSTHRIVTALAERGVAPSATASVLARGLDGLDWSFVLSSDI